MVFRRGNVYWYQFQIDGKRIRESAKTTNRTGGAKRRKEKRRSHVRDGCPVEVLPFVVAFESFLEWSRSHVKPNTYKRYRVSGKRLKAHFGDTKLSGVGTQGHRSFSRTDRIQECSGAGCNRGSRLLRTFLKWAVR